MEPQWFAIGDRAKVKEQGEYNWHLKGDPLPDGVCGRSGAIIPVQSVQGLPVSGDRLLPLVFIRLDDSRTFMIHQDNLDPL